MDKESIINNLKNRLGTDILEISSVNERRAVVSVSPGSLLSCANYLYGTAGLRFIIASALHTKRGFEIHYHFSHDQTGLVLNIHVLLDKVNPQVESLSNLFSASNWIEREMHELFGINFLNHPNQEKLISEGNWAEGVYPLRKEFK
jgi:NADH:ubiquinone oxidoreductase subunit C